MSVTLLTQKELARLLGGLSLRTLERWRVQGYGPRFLKVGRSIRYRLSDVNEWLNRQERRSTSH